MVKAQYPTILYSKNVTVIALGLNNYWVGRYIPVSSNVEKNAKHVETLFCCLLPSRSSTSLIPDLN